MLAQDKVERPTCGRLPAGRTLPETRPPDVCLSVAGASETEVEVEAAAGTADEEASEEEEGAVVTGMLERRVSG